MSGTTRTWAYGLAAAAVVAVAAPAGAAEAACEATLNGQPMPPSVCAVAVRLYGEMQPGDYWMDSQGYWGRAGSREPQSNLLTDVERDRVRRPAWSRQNPLLVDRDGRIGPDAFEIGATGIHGIGP